MEIGTTTGRLWIGAVTGSRVAVLDTVCLHCGETLAADGQFGTILGPDVCNGVIIPTCTNIAVPTKS